jgi:hypothetical protein
MRGFRLFHDLKVWKIASIRNVSVLANGSIGFILPLYDFITSVTKSTLASFDSVPSVYSDSSLLKTLNVGRPVFKYSLYFWYISYFLF